MSRRNPRPGQHQQQHRSQHQNYPERNDLAVSLVVAVPVTSRSIGFCTVRAYRNIYCLGNPRHKRSNMYRSYRAFLALFQAKVFTASPRSWLQGVASDEELFHQQRPILQIFRDYGKISVPSEIAALVNSVGVIKADGRVFVPFIAPNNYTREGAFIPQSEHVYLYNLRETVSALAVENTALEYRLKFHEHNPIPGTIWRGIPENPILMNPDDIIPASYSVSRDLDEDCRQGVAGMKWDAENSNDPESDSDFEDFDSDVRFESVDLSAVTLSGRKSLLMCDEQRRWKVEDRRMGEGLGEYCCRGWVQRGNTGSDTHNLAIFTENEASCIKKAEVHNFRFLLGECPLFLPLRYPYYWVRETHMCCQYNSNYLVPEAIPLCVTTRAIGFGVVKAFQSLSEIKGGLGGDIYAVYRAALCLIQLKIKQAKKKCSDLYYSEVFSGSHRVSSRDINCSISVIDPIARPINTVGFLQINDLKFAPVIAGNKTDSSVFVPQSEHVYLTNLRETVEALANENTPVEYRIGFYRNNPIPGTVWRGAPENPILINSDDVIPADYNLEKHIHKDIHATHVFMSSEQSFHKQLKSVDIDADGEKGMLTCNDQNNMRVVDRHEGEHLLDYYRRLKIEGNINEFHNLMPLNRDEQLDGIMCLLGERPLVKDFRYPNYVTRDKEVCVQRCNVPYAQCSNYFHHMM